MPTHPCMSSRFGFRGKNDMPYNAISRLRIINEYGIARRGMHGSVYIMVIIMIHTYIYIGFGQVSKDGKHTQ